MPKFLNEEFTWMNPGTLTPEENGFSIAAPPHSDFFRDPTEDKLICENAPFFSRVPFSVECVRSKEAVKATLGLATS